MSNKTSYNQIVTPAGELCWIRIFGKGQESQGKDNRYIASVRLANDSKELAAIKKQINDFWNANKPEKIKQCKSNGIKEEVVDGKPTGFSLVHFWTTTSYPDGNRNVVKLLDVNKKPLELNKGTAIGEGTQGRISGNMKIYTSQYEGGVTLYLNAIQVIELVEHVFEDTGTSNKDDYGF